MSAPLSPSGERRGAGQGFPASLIVLTVALLAARLALGGAIHLTEDESYYRLWSMAPALGYDDHPPMIAWWIWLGRRLAGDTALGVRLLPSLACAATSLMVFDLARVIGAGRASAVRAGLWFNAMLLIAAGGFLATPDAPASFFWTATLCCALRAVQRSSWRWWAAAGLAAGFATLSKYSALFLAPGLFAWLAATPNGRAQLRAIGPWLALGIAAGLFVLNLVWNADHGWLTFHKQFGRIAAHRFAPRYLVEFIAGQVLLVNPIFAVFVGAAFFGAGARERIARLTPLMAASAPFAGYLLIHSLHDRVQAHWPAPLYPGLAVIAAVAAEPLKQGPIWRRLAAGAPALALALCSAALVFLWSPSPKPDLAGPVRGWPTFASALESARVRAGAAWVGATSYGVTAQLAGEPGIKAPIIQLSERERWTTLNPGGTPDFSRPGLVVDLPRRVSAAALATCFDRVSPLGTLTRDRTAYAAFVVAGPRRDIARSGC